jgi:hypothetical protein
VGFRTRPLPVALGLVTGLLGPFAMCFSRIVLPGLLLLLPGCSTSGSQEQLRTDAAVEVVQRFVDAETRRNMDAAWAMLCGCEMLPMSDYFMPSLTAEVIQAKYEQDSVLVEVRYLVLGKMFSLDRGEVGERNWRFFGDVGVDTVFFYVLDDPVCGLAISCGDFPPIHVGVPEMADLLERFDDSSRANWEEALTVASDLRPSTIRD